MTDMPLQQGEEMQVVRHRASGRPSTAVTWSALVAAISLALLIIGSAVGILNWLYVENNHLRDQITALNVQIARDTVSRPELKEALRDLTRLIEKRLDRLEEVVVTGRQPRSPSPR